MILNNDNDNINREYIIPNDHISVDLLYFWPNNNSGDIQKGVPMKESFYY
jgi:hypothetical protein